MLFAGNQRFLYPQHQPGPMPGPSVVSDEDDGLGPLPSGWEKRVQPEGQPFISPRNIPRITPYFGFRTHLLCQSQEPYDPMGGSPDPRSGN